MHVVCCSGLVEAIHDECALRVAQVPRDASEIISIGRGHCHQLLFHLLGNRYDLNSNSLLAVSCMLRLGKPEDQGMSLNILNWQVR